MKSAFAVIFFLFLCFFSFSYSNAQQIVYPESTTNVAVHHAVSLYSAAIKDRLNIYNGVSYNGYPYRLTEGNSYFPDDKWQVATIRYDGVTYKDVKCMYDLVQGSLVVLYIDNYSRIALHKERIESAEFAGHRFVRTKNIGEDNSYDLYDELYKGSVRILAKRSKRIEERTSLAGLERNVTTVNSYVLEKDGKMTLINSKKDLFSLLKDKKAKIKQHLKEKSLSYQKNKEETIIAAVNFYDRGQ